MDIFIFLYQNILYNMIGEFKKKILKKLRGLKKI